MNHRRQENASRSKRPTAWYDERTDVQPDLYREVPSAYTSTSTSTSHARGRRRGTMTDAPSSGPPISRLQTTHRNPSALVGGREQCHGPSALSTAPLSLHPTRFGPSLGDALFFLLPRLLLLWFANRPAMTLTHVHVALVWRSSNS